MNRVFENIEDAVRCIEALSKRAKKLDSSNKKDYHELLSIREQMDYLLLLIEENNPIQKHRPKFKIIQGDRQ